MTEGLFCLRIFTVGKPRFPLFVGNSENFFQNAKKNECKTGIFLLI